MSRHNRNWIHSLVAGVSGVVLVASASILPVGPASAQIFTYHNGPLDRPVFMSPQRHFRFGVPMRQFRPSYHRANHRRPGPLPRRRASQAAFRVTHENHAWGHQKSSCEIRDDGRIMQVQFSNPPDRVLGYEEIGRISAREVDRMSDLLSRAAGRALTEPRQVMADFGSTTLTGLYRGRPVELKIWGDFVSVNPSRAATRLITWATSVFPESCPRPVETDL